MYEYGARNYDPAVGRFFNIDRLTEKYESISPYNYTANNPVRFIDVDGEWIDIYDGGNKYRYQMGGGVQMYNKETKEWDVVEDITSLSFYVQQVIANLYELETSGLTGGAIIGYFNNDSRQVDFRGYHKLSTHATTGSLYNNIYVRNGFATNDILTVDGLQAAKMFVIFGHELAHVIDRYENPKRYKDAWAYKSNGDPISRSEIFASHIENQIRAQSGLPLRQYYGISKDESGRQFGLKGTLLLDSDNNSLYFRQTAPSIFDIQNRGEIINQKIEQIKRKDERYNY